MDVLSPSQVELRLHELDSALEESFTNLEEAEYDYANAKTALELALAKSRIELTDSGKKMTVSEKDDRAMVDNEGLFFEAAIAEACAKAARANANKLRAQVDIVRSMGASLRASMEL